MLHLHAASQQAVTRVAASLLAAGVCLLVLLSSSLALAQSEQTLISFIDNPDPALVPPTYATSAQRVAINSAVLIGIQIGSNLQIQVSEDKVVILQVAEVSTYINGDWMIRAQGMNAGEFYSLTLTVGQQALFGHLSTSDGILQIYAIGDNTAYEGWLYRPGTLGDGSNALQNDYLIPDYDRTGAAVVKPIPELYSTLPLTIGDPVATDSSDSAAASVAEIDATNFKISQKFSPNPVVVGNSVEAEITFENISSEWHRDIVVEIFFLLENSSLLLAPYQCQEQLSLSLQKILYCELGDFAPGESKLFTYTVATSEQSKPFVICTPIVGNLRSDSYFNVVDDVLVDSDGDGISDIDEFLLNTDPANPDSVDYSNAIIDVMAFYTPGAASLYPGGIETRINQLVSVANQIYADSGVGITLRPVYHGEVDYNDVDDMDTALDHIIEKTDPAFAEVDELRMRFGGDLVMLFRPLGLESARCGLAPVGGFNTNGDFSAAVEKEFAYAHIAIDCPTDIVIAHELGHNMGLTHSHFEDGSGGTFNFSTGYGVDSEFVTVMAFPEAFNTEMRIAQFSNPLLECLGFVCGVSSDEEFGADAVQSLNIVRHQIANFFVSTVPDLPATLVAALSGDTNATIAIAASSDGGLSFSSTVTPSDLVDIVADISVDDRHVGMEGSLHILVGLVNQGFFQFNSAGELVSWDGSVPGLTPLRGVGPLKAHEHLTILDGYRFDASLVGQQVMIYIAYQIAETGDIIYTVNPLLLTIQQASVPIDYDE